MLAMRREKLPDAPDRHGGSFRSRRRLRGPRRFDPAADRSASPSRAYGESGVSELPPAAGENCRLGQSAPSAPPISPITPRLPAISIRCISTSPLRAGSALRAAGAWHAAARGFRTAVARLAPDLVTIGLSGQFLTPVLEDQTATLSARVAKIEAGPGEFVAVLRLMAHTETGAPALVGEARLTPAR